MRILFDQGNSVLRNCGLAAARPNVYSFDQKDYALQRSAMWGVKNMGLLRSPQRSFLGL